MCRKRRDKDEEEIFIDFISRRYASKQSLAGCGSAEQAADAGGSTASDATEEDAAAGDDAAAEAPAASADAIRLVNGKIEIDEQLKAIAKTYQGRNWSGSSY